MSPVNLPLTCILCGRHPACEKAAAEARKGSRTQVQERRAMTTENGPAGRGVWVLFGDPLRPQSGTTTDASRTTTNCRYWRHPTETIRGPISTVTRTNDLRT